MFLVSEVPLFMYKAYTRNAQVNKETQLVPILAMVDPQPSTHTLNPKPSTQTLRLQP